MRYSLFYLFITLRSVLTLCQLSSPGCCRFQLVLDSFLFGIALSLSELSIFKLLIDMCYMLNTSLGKLIFVLKAMVVLILSFCALLEPLKLFFLHLTFQESHSAHSINRFNCRAEKKNYHCYNEKHLCRNQDEANVFSELGILGEGRILPYLLTPKKWQNYPQPPFRVFNDISCENNQEPKDK